MSYLQNDVVVNKNAKLEYRIVGPSATVPTPTTGYEIDPDPITIQGVQGKFWLEYKIIEL